MMKYTTVAIFILSLFTCFFSSGPVMAGHELKGRVLDVNEEGIMGATVVLQDSMQTILSFGITARDGSYRLESINYSGQSILRIRSVGFREKIDSLYWNSQPVEQIRNYTLESETYKFQEIEVSAEVDWPVYQRADTTIFRVADYMDPSVDVMEDLLKQLPGVRVSQSGIITFKGREIDRILFEGADLLGSSYTVASRTLRADLIKEIHAVENYTENPMLRGLINEEKVVLDLKLQEDAKFRISGNSYLGYGNSNRHNAGADVFNLNKRIINYSFLKSNSVGQLPLAEWFQPGENRAEAMPKMDDLRPEPVTRLYFPLHGMDERWLNDNFSRSVSLNNLVTTDGKAKIRLNYHYHSDKNVYERLKTSRYQLPGLTFDFTEDQVFREESPYLHRGHVFLEYPASSSVLFRLHTLVDGSRKDQFNLMQTSDSTLEELLESEFFSFTPFFQTTWRISEESVFQFRSGYQNSRTRQDYAMRDPDLTGAGSAQENQMKTDYLKNQVQFYTRRRAFDIDLSGEWIRASHYHETDFFANENSPLESSQSFANRVRINRESIALDARLIFISNQQILQMGSGIVKERFQDRDDVLKRYNRRLLYFRPFVILNRNLSKESALIASYRFDRELPRVWSLYPEPVLSNYRLLRSGFESISFFPVHRLGMILTHNDFFRRYISGSLLVNYSFYKRNIGFQREINPDWSLYRYRYVGGTSSMLISLNLDKYLRSLKGSLRYSSSMLYSESINDLNEQQSLKSKLWSLNSEVSFSSSWTQAFKIEPGVRFNFVSHTTSGKSLESVRYYPYMVTVISPFSNIDISVNGYWYGFDTSQDSALFLNAAIRYRMLQNKFSASLSFHNLLNHSEYAYRTVGEYFSSKERLITLERYLFLSLRYRY